MHHERNQILCSRFSPVDAVATFCSLRKRGRVSLSVVVVIPFFLVYFLKMRSSLVSFPSVMVIVR